MIYSVIWPIEKILPYKTKRVKGNTQKWFDGEVLEKSKLWK